MLRKPSLTLISMAGLMLAAPLAVAHEGLYAAGGFVAGFLHPLTGLDHLLVALVAGGWALHGSRGGRWRLALFAGALLCGAALAGIAPVLPVLGVAVIVTAIMLPCRFPHVLFGAAGIWHGMQHLQAMPATVTLSGYVGGLLLATALLLVSGMAGWRLLRRYTGLLNG